MRWASTTNAMHQARSELHSEDVLFAFLDDLYVLTTRSRAAAAIQTVTRQVEAMAGVRTHLGKLEAWSAVGGAAPPGLAAITPTA